MSPASPRVQEPSMEEILASIRRIIADDQVRPPRLRPDLPPAEPEPREIEAAAPPALAVEEAPVETSAPETGSPNVESLPEATASDFEASSLDESRFETERPADEPPAPMIQVPPAAVEPAPASGLVSSSIEATIAGSFGRLAATLHPPQPARTMEEHVTEMLRPMLRSWLDENLPALVERLVEAEIERLARQRR